MSDSRRFEAYLAGSLMLLLGLLLIALLVGLVALGLLPPLFLIGVGIIFSVMAVLKASAPVQYQMAARTTLAYGLLGITIGILWIALAVQTATAGYILAVLLILFGLVFLAYFSLALLRSSGRSSPR
jgi:cytochrome c biogenesis protein CcdA